MESDTDKQEAGIEIEADEVARKTEGKRKSIWKSDRMKFLYGGVFVFIITASSEFSLENNLIPGSGIAKDFLTWLLSIISNNGYNFGYAVLTLVSVSFIAKFIWDYVWEDRVKDFLKKYIEKLDQDLKQVNTKTVSVLESTQSEVKNLLDDHIAKTNKLLSENELLLAISRCDQNLIIESLREIHVKAYGDHCQSEKGLYESTNRLVSKYLHANVPHRSNHNQDIIIEACEEDPDYVKWTEDTFYELHTIAVDPDYKTPKDTEKLEHELTYNSSASYKKLDEILITIYVDENQIITTEGNIEINLGQDGEVASVHSKLPEMTIEKDDDSDEWTISIKRKIDITKPKIQVSIHEESYIKENFFVVCRDVPTCSSTVSVTLPSTWTFDHMTVPLDQSWKIIQSVPYKRKATTTDWVLPGIAMACAWKRYNPENKKAVE
ncbi:hypothetical protein [Marinobacter sp. SS13-12]|uniref:hypothetical protein n=1 Tax=Marinobacter sp. SS13-12 TaxID=3050451 RepID=UPI0025549182|nr:hypothetical protein [Marinobacter sp. SS13-12]MDK8463083.1 hypothetical protein [Marinobacter sp. SS13-12]